MSDQYDVVVVGAGFAGATAARECASRGLRVLVLEARDRIGGRSGSLPLADGSAADVGGTFVHWTQPHTWAEISRYGLQNQVVRGRVEHDWVGMYAHGTMTWSSPTETNKFSRQAMEKALAESSRVFPNPAAPLQNRAAVEEIDGLTVTEGLAQLELDEAEREYLEITLGAYAARPADEASWSGNLRWYAMGLDNYDDYVDMLMNWKLKCGTGGLISRIIADGGAEVRLNSPVKSIASRSDGVTVTLADGQSFQGATSIIAVPANVWSHLDLTPALPPAQFEASRAGMSGHWAGKAVAVIRGESRSVMVTGDETAPLSFFTSAFHGPDEQAIAIYPMDPSIDLGDKEVMRKAITTLLPHVTVVDSTGDRYLADDPFFRGAWGFLGPGQLTKYVPHENFTRLDERTVFATSDIGELFHGFIDGAIESGMRAARDVRRTLKDNS